MQNIMDRTDWSTITAHCPLHFNASAVVPASGEAVNSFRIPYRDSYSPSYQWDGSRYLRFYNDKPFVDGSTNEQVKVDNVIVQSVEYAWFAGQSDRPYVNILGSNRCEYFIGGKHITGYWVRDNLNTNTRYYDDAGNEILFNPGVTYIQLLKTEKSLEILG